MTNTTLNVVVITDLDGTLLDRASYSYGPAIPALDLLQERKIPLVFCSAKTRAEQEVYRKELEVYDPFIVENGGAIFIPRGYFPFGFNCHKAEDAYQIIELGIPYCEIRQTLEQIRADTEVNFRGFGDMSAEEVAADTGLDRDAAWRAKERGYDETVKLEGSPEEIDRVLNAIKKAGLNYALGDRYYDITGPNDKGRAVTILIDLFRKKLGRVGTVAIGDSLNDLPMLAAVDIPILVEKLGGAWEKIDLPMLRRVKGIGPVGWRQAIEELLNTLCKSF